ncbi:hypothetical protein B0H10DRAFT_2096326 [Mycena sp. CBHHK59/15]|nr:hypothetical protein B0H10DRAFT_2096326 [Mycena sp. CBHHK59/15]
MPKPWAKEKTRRRRLGAEEEARHFASVHTPLSPSPIPPATHPRAVTSAPAPIFSRASPPHNSSWYQDDVEISTILTICTPSLPASRDFSSLRSPASAHPWRTIRRRNHRLLPQRRVQRPFPISLPKRTLISAPRADTLAVHAILPSLSPQHPPPLSSVIDVPSPSVMAAKTPVTLPAMTAYGLVHTKFALACAGELPDIVVTLEQVFDLVWGPHVDDDQKNLLVGLPPDRLVFLCTLAAIAGLEPVFEGFLQPVIMNFARAWVAHCRGDSFG